MSRFIAIGKAKHDVVECKPSKATVSALAELADASTMCDFVRLQGYMSASERRAWAGCWPRR